MMSITYEVSGPDHARGELARGDIVTSFAGLRALVDTNLAKTPSSVPREEQILKSNSGMLSIAGGKLTTHRRIAQRVVDTICRELGKPVEPSPTLTTPLPGARPDPGGRFRRRKCHLPPGWNWPRATAPALH